MDQLVVPSSQKARLAYEVVARLKTAHHSAYWAGGCVRDIILGRKPKDYDIATSATPEEIERLFSRTIPIGREYGILIVRLGGHSFEVATFRGEEGFTDRRRPDRVYWTTAKEDALRRDFTINALFLDPITVEVIDFVGGQADLANRIIRFVGDPKQRINEDHLRILRAIRLKNALDFQYDAASYRALRTQARQIETISVERIRDELNKIWTDAHRAATLEELAELEVLPVILPEVDALRGVPQPLQYHHEGDVFDHTLRAVAALPKRVPSFLVWAVLLHDIGKAATLVYPQQVGGRIRFDQHKTVGARLAREIGVRLHMPRVEIDTIAWLVDHHMDLKGIETLRKAKRRQYLLNPRFRWLLEVHRADALGTLPADLSLYRETKALYSHYLQLWKSEQKNGRPQPLVTGHDLQIELGLSAGPKIGLLLEQLHEAQLEHQITSREEALTLARQLQKQ